LAKDCASVGVRRFIFISSIGVYGRGATRPLTESDTPQPVEDYAISKLEAEHGVLEVGRQSGMEIVIIRAPLVYGADAPGNFGLLFKSVIKKIPLPFGLITFNKRTFVGIDNLADLVVRCTYHPAAANQIFLAADDKAVSTAEFIEEIGIACGIRPLNLKVPCRILKFLFAVIGRSSAIDKLTLSLEVSNRKALEVLGWSPPHTMREELEKMIGRANKLKIKLDDKDGKL
jgi:nucleoside-diphosphate-sugar epimerase